MGLLDRGEGSLLNSFFDRSFCKEVFWDNKVRGITDNKNRTLGEIKQTFLRCSYFSETCLDEEPKEEIPYG